MTPPSVGVCTTLTFLARMTRANAVIEIGTGTGTTGLAFFEGMSESGMLTTIDTQADLQFSAREAFKKQGIEPRRVRLISGLVLNVLNNLRAKAYDIVFINGNKLEYVEYLDQAERLLRPGGLVILNDCLWHNLVADPEDESDETLIIREALESLTNSDSFTHLMLPVGEGLAIGLKKSR